MSVNLVILVGNVGKDPDVHTFDNGTKKASFTLATSEKFKDRDGNVQEKTEWHNVVCWRNTAEIAEKFVKKGTQVYVQGKITTRKWQDQNGQDRYTTEIDINTLQLLGRKQDRDGYQQSQPAYGQPQPTYQAPPAAAPAPTPDPSQSLEPQSDDLPF